jgi:hypothetical protein
MPAAEHPLKEALDELGAANKNLNDVSVTWGEALTTMHIAEIALREAKRRVASAYALVRSAAPGVT